MLVEYLLRLITFVKDEPPQKHSAPYEQLVCFNYHIDLNPRWNVAMRSIRDYVGLPNAGDHSLVLGKAYLQLPSRLHLFASYFILGHPQMLNGEVSEKLP